MEGGEASEAPDLDYFLGAGSAGGAGGDAVRGPEGVPVSVGLGADSAHADAAAGAFLDGATADKAASTPASTSAPASGAPVTQDASAQRHSAQNGAASTGATGGTDSRKRKLDDKKARDKKRILRNRELARVSNERRKGRIKAMENELDETRKTVSSLEESIRSLEAENNDLKSLLANKS